MKDFFTTKRICRAGIIAALYVALTCSFGAIGYSGFLEIRPAEALCILPLFYAEAIPALFIGCMLGNLISQFGIYDILLGPVATLIAAFATYGIGRLVKNHIAKVAAGGIFPVLVNAFLVPVIIVVLYGDHMGYGSAAIAYWTCFASLVVTQSLWVYALGSPLYYFICKMRKKGVAVFLDGKKILAEKAESSAENNGI